MSYLNFKRFRIWNLSRQSYKNKLQTPKGRNEKFLISCKCNQGQACLSRSNVNVHHFVEHSEKSYFDLSRVLQENYICTPPSWHLHNKGCLKCVNNVYIFIFWNKLKNTWTRLCVMKISSLTHFVKFMFSAIIILLENP